MQKSNQNDNRIVVCFCLFFFSIQDLVPKCLKELSEHSICLRQSFPGENQPEPTYPLREEQERQLLTVNKHFKHSPPQQSKDKYATSGNNGTVVVSTHFHLSTGIVNLFSYSLFPLAVVAEMAANQTDKQFDKAIHMNLILADNSVSNNWA